MPRAQEGDLVRIVYQCRLDNGTVFDFEETRDPLELTLGEGETIPLFDRAVIGMEPGETKTLRVPASALTGVSLETISQKLGVKEIPGEVTSFKTGLDIGPGPDGDLTTVLVPGLANVKFSLAGEDVTFEVKLVEIVERRE